MNKQVKKVVSVILSLCLACGVNFTPSEIKAEDTLTNVANNRNNYTFMTSNANNGTEGFLYVGNGFSAINACNESLGNGNNLLGATATTDEVAIYVDLGKNYDISRALIYQGSTNSNYYDSYCRNFSVYYSTEQVSAANSGNISWNLAGTCSNGTIYSGAKVKNAEYTSDSGDEVTFNDTYTARSVKVVFDKESCLGTGTNGNSTGTTGTVSLLSVRVYGKEIVSDTTPESTTASPSETSTAAEVTTSDDGVTDVLFIGNSMTYYNTLCNVVQGIATRKGHNVKCKAATNGGRNLIFQSTAENILNAIKTGGYEIVVLQDIVGSFDGDNLQTGAEAIVPTIKQYNPNARIIFYEPWPTKNTILGESSLLPYFTHSYIQTTKSMGAELAPAGEAFYELYATNGLDYYCGDGKHPQPLGTFTSAASIYYTMYPEEEYKAFSSADQTYLDNLINTNAAYTSEGVQTTYNLETLNLIYSLGYKYSHAVIPAVEGKDTYTSVAGSYTDPDEGLNPDGLPAIQGETVDAAVFTKANGNMAVGCKAYASNERQSAANAVDGNTGTRWETDYADPQWLYVDLGATKEINKVGFMWEGAYASKYYVQISDDANEWKTVAVVRAATNKNVQIDLGKKYSTRYVRMYGTKRGTGYGYSFYEMGVWNVAGASDTETTTPEVTTETQTTKQETTTTPTETQTTKQEITVAPTEPQTTKQETTEAPTEPQTTKQETTVAPTEPQTTKQETTVAPTEPQTTKQEITVTEKQTTVAEASTTNKDKVTTQAPSTSKVKIAKAKIRKVTKTKSSPKVKLTLKRIKKATGYQVYILKKKNGKKAVVKRFTKKVSFTIKSKKLRNKKKLFVKVRGYVLVGGKKKYGKWSSVKKIKIKNK